MKQRILIIEDDLAMGTALRDGFGFEGYDAELVADGARGLEKAFSAAVDLIVLDVMLPGLSGLDVCRNLRAQNVQTPIIMLTARGQEIDKVLGLRLGADDYVTKPFGLTELLARVEAILRRSNPAAKYAQPASQVLIGEVSVNFAARTATKAGEPLQLSAREYEILQYFVLRQNQVVTRGELLEQVWGLREMPLTRTVDQHIAKLRQKIETNANAPQHVLTIHRLGYRFVGAN